MLLNPVAKLNMPCRITRHNNMDLQVIVVMRMNKVGYR